MDKYYGAATLSDVNESSVLKYLILDIDLIHQSHEISFSVIVNSLYFYSGIMYTDGGTTAWGQIQQRNSDNAPGSLYSFYYNRGADPVLKKLGSPTIKTKTVTGNGSFDAGGKVLFAGIQNAGLHIMTYAQKYGQGSHYSATCSYTGNMITYDQHAYGENTSGTDQYSMTIIYAVE